MRVTDRASTVLLSLILGTVSCAVTPPAKLDPGSTDGGDASAQADATQAETARIARVIHDWDPRMRPAEAGHLAAVITSEARRAGLPPTLVLAMIEVESGGYNFAVSSVGARGLMQLLPDTGAFVAAISGLPWWGAETLFDPAANVRLGVRYLEHLLNRYPDLRTALTAYNWGPALISRRLRQGEALPLRYAERVMSVWSGSSREI